MPGGRPTDYKPEYCQMLIDHMAKGNSFWSFAAIVNVCFKTIGNWCQDHEEFLQAKNNGMAKLLKFDEDLGRAGVAGQLTKVSKVERITDEDGNVREIKHYESATFAQTFHIFTLKNRYPKLYRDKIQIEDTTDNSKKTRKTLVDIMKDPALREAALLIADKMSDPDEPEES